MKRPKLVADQDKFMLRLPDGMRERIADEAKSSGRSMNAEIVLRLESSFDTPLSIKPQLLRPLQEHIDAEVEARLRAREGQSQPEDGGGAA